MPREHRTRSGRQSLPYSILRVSVPLWFDQTVPVSGTGKARGTQGHACLQGKARHPDRSHFHPPGRRTVMTTLWFDQTVPVSGTGKARGTHGHACLQRQACHPDRPHFHPPGRRHVMATPWWLYCTHSRALRAGVERAHRLRPVGFRSEFADSPLTPQTARSRGVHRGEAALRQRGRTRLRG